MIRHEGARHGWRAAIISAVLAIGIYAALAFWGDARRFADAATAVGLPTLGVLLALSLANYALRAVRWHLYLARLGHRLPWLAASVNYLAGFALTTTPGKAGETIRSVYLKRRFGVPLADSLAAFVSDRFSDVLALVVLAALAAAMLPYGAWVAGGVIAFVLFALWIAASDRRTAAAFDLVERLVPHRLVEPIARMAGQAGRLTRGGTLVIGLALALVGWLAEGYALWLIMTAMQSSVAPATAIGIYALALLGGALFFLPAGLGSTEAFMYTLLVQAGLDSASAAAATVISRVTTLWFAVVLGWIALLFHRDPGRL